MSRLDNLEFLSDIVPKTVPFKAIKERKPAAKPTTVALATNGEVGDEPQSGEQATLTSQQPLINGTNGFGTHARGDGFGDEVDDGAADPNAQLERESAGVKVGITSAGGNASGEDVEMLH